VPLEHRLVSVPYKLIRIYLTPQYLTLTKQHGTALYQNQTWRNRAQRYHD